MFRYTFSSSNVHRKIFIPAETKEITDNPPELRALNMMGSENWHRIWGCPTALDFAHCGVHEAKLGIQKFGSDLDFPSEALA